jgi:hypothetical protein
MVQLVAQLPEFFFEHVATSDKSNIIFESADHSDVEQDSRRRLGPLASDLPFAVGSRKILNLTHMHTHPHNAIHLSQAINDS